MNREFLINVLFLVSINLLIKPFFIFGIDRTVQNTVGEESYGLYFALVNFAYLLQMLNDFGIHSFNNRNIAQHNQLLQKYFPNIVVLKFLLGMGYLLVTFTVAWFMGYTIYGHLLFFIALNQILISLNYFVRSNISGLAFYRTDSALSALDKLLMIIICGFLLWWPGMREQFRIEWFIYAQTTALALTALTSFILLRPHLPPLQFRFNLTYLRLILKESYPYALVGFLMIGYTRIDGVMLERLLPNGDFEAGVYASAYRLLDAANMVGFLFAGLLLPMFARMIKEKAPVQQLLKFSFLLLWCGAMTLAISTGFHSESIVSMLYTNATPYWGSVLRWLMFSFVAVSGIHIVGTLLTANGNMMKMNVIFIFGIVLNVGLNYWLIFPYKAAGAAIATVATQFFVFFAQVFLVWRIFDLRFNWWMITRILVFGGLLTIAGYGLSQWPLLDWKVNFCVNILVGLGLAFLLKLIDWQNIKALLPKK